VRASDIGVEVRDGVVTLAGHVGSYLEKFDAERAAQRVNGVKALAVEIDVKLSALGKRSDTDIARSAQNVLEWMATANKDTVKVMVEDGWITLSGQVDWQYQKQAAVDAVRPLMGVVGVSNQIVLAPRLTLNAVQAEIEAALKRQAKVEASKITVQVTGSDVTLTGTVSSWAERDSARDSAWRTPGVHNVVDNLSIAA